MLLTRFEPATRWTRFLTIGFLFAFTPAALAWNEDEQKDAEATLVRVNITTETVSAAEIPVQITGRVIKNYRPKIIQVFPSTGVVIDDKGHVMAFLGYQWVDMQTGNPRIDIITTRGEKYPAKMVGIDQSMGVAVMLCMGGKLRKTPLCTDCEIREGSTVVTPVFHDAGLTRFQSANVLSVGSLGTPRRGEAWQVTFSGSLPGVGMPLLNDAHSVIGFVKSLERSSVASTGVSTVVYPVSQLLSSAEKIIKRGGDIRSGWLGVYIDDYSEGSRSGVLVRGVEAESPAQKSGLRPQDVLLRWDGDEIKDTRGFIQLVQDTPIGSKVVIDVLRRGRPMTLYTQVESRKPRNQQHVVLRYQDLVRLQGGKTGEAESPMSRLGVDTVMLTPQLAEFLRMPGQTGLLVSGVNKDGAFDSAGVLAGDVILEADGVPVMDPEAFVSRLTTRDWGKPLHLKLLRHGNRLDLDISLPPRR